MQLTLEEKKSILDKPIDYIYDNHLLSNHAYCFGSERTLEAIDLYDDFKRKVSELLDVHKNNVHIFGSGKIGFSLNPSKGLKNFSVESDIDIAIVSDNYYDLFREEYFKDFYLGRFNYQYHKKVTSAIFRKFIIFDGFTEKSNEYKKWIEKTGGFKSTLQIHYELPNDINYRIFSNWDSVMHYYKKSIKECKEIL